MGFKYFISYMTSMQYPNDNIYIKVLHFVKMQYLKEGFNLFYFIHNINALPLEGKCTRLFVELQYPKLGFISSTTSMQYLHEGNI